MIAEQIAPKTAIQLAVYRGALERLNACRRKCPGIGGDVCAMNLRAMIDRQELSQKAAEQAARTLEDLSIALEIDARAEVVALRALSAL